MELQCVMLFKLSLRLEPRPALGQQLASPSELVQDSRRCCGVLDTPSEGTVACLTPSNRASTAVWRC